MRNRIPILFVGTDSGLIAWNTTGGTESIGSPYWVFNKSNAEYFVDENIYDSTATSRVNILQKEETDSIDKFYFDIGYNF